jgi:hypothetical protein
MPAFQQGAASPLDATSTPSVSATYPNAQQAGDLNIVVIGWYAVAGSVGAITDTAGNSYKLAVGPTTYSGGADGLTQAVYYAQNIKAAPAGNVVTAILAGVSAADSGVVRSDLRIAEYSGVSGSSALDTTNVCKGEDPTPDGCKAMTQFAPSVVVVGAMTNCGFVNLSPAGLTNRVFSPYHNLILDYVTSFAPFGYTWDYGPDYGGTGCSTGHNLHNEFILQVAVFH